MKQTRVVEKAEREREKTFENNIEEHIDQFKKRSDIYCSVSEKTERNK